MTEKTKKKVNPVEEITSFKGFNDKWECRGFKFKPGETFHHDGQVKACESGFHACEYPLDVFNYYPPAGSRFAVVKQYGDLSRHDGGHDGDTKVSSKSISIMAEINIAVLVKAAIEYTTSRCKPVDHVSPASATGYQGAASATGESSVAAATGWNGRAQGAEGCAIVLVHRDDYGKIIHIRASKVGDNGIKPGVWYKLSSDGHFVEITQP